MRKLLWHLAPLALVGCAVHGPFEASERQRFDQYVRDNPKVSVDNPSASPDGDLIAGKPDMPQYRGEYEKREVLDKEDRRLTAQFERMVAFDPNASVLFPGALVTGDSLVGGILTPLVSARSSQVCTVSDLVSVDPHAKFSDTFVPSLSAWDDFRRRTLGQELAQEQPANMTYSQKTVYKFEQAYMQLGASYHWTAGNAALNFSTQRQGAHSRFMVRFVQKYYTASCALPSDGYMALFPYWTTDFEHMNSVLKSGSAPAYVDSVTYGRELWMFIESDEEQSKADADFRVAFDALASGGQVGGAAGATDVFKTATIQVYALGGGGKPAVQVITGNPAALQRYINAGANVGKDSPGAPISYTVRYLKDNTLARVSATTDYTIDTWKPSPVPAPATSATVTWKVVGQHQKDWDTQARAYLETSGGRTLASIECCSSAKDGTDEWHVGASETRAMSIVPAGFTDRDVVDHGILKVSSRPNGNNNWSFDATVIVNFADKTQLIKSCSGQEHCSVTW